jgi:DNA-binding transcriptional LysR family regulator
MLVLSGEGVGVLPEYLVAKDLSRRRLVRVLPKVKLLHDFFRLVFRADDPKQTIYQSIVRTMQSEPLR